MNEIIYHTLVFVTNPDGTQVLLGRKKEDFGKGKWNGYGGKMEEHEDASSCAIRQLKEGAHLKVTRKDLKYVGYASVRRYEIFQHLIYIFKTNKVDGILEESDDMLPRWYDKSEIPYGEMWEDSEFWVPLIFSDKSFVVNLEYNSDRLTAKEVEITQIPDLPTEPVLNSLTNPGIIITRKDLIRKKLYTIVFVMSEDKILLGLKKRGLATNKWNGFGGKVEENENAYSSAVRELKEESNLSVLVNDLEYKGFISKKNSNEFIYVFITSKVTGILEESEEMFPKWFDIKDIPYDDMWEDSRLWMPLLSLVKPLYINLEYDDDNTLVESEILTYAFPFKWYTGLWEEVYPDRDHPQNKFYTIIFVTNHDETRVLLGMKKRGFGVGLWNGYGGKIEVDEDPRNSAIRELKEESNLTVRREDLKFVSLITFERFDGWQHVAFVFKTETVQGPLKETDEMSPKCFDVDKLPFDKMWEDAIHWVPLVFRKNQSCFIMRFEYKANVLTKRGMVSDVSEFPFFINVENMLYWSNDPDYSDMSCPPSSDEEPEI